MSRVFLASMSNGSCAKGSRAACGTRQSGPPSGLGSALGTRNVGSMCTVHQLLLSAISRCITAVKGGTYIVKGVVNVALYRSSSNCHVLSIQYRLQHTAACDAREFIKLPKIHLQPFAITVPPILRFQSDTCRADTVIHSPIICAPSSS
jgi:hypothetical protein